MLDIDCRLTFTVCFESCPNWSSTLTVELFGSEYSRNRVPASVRSTQSDSRAIVLPAVVFDWRFNHTLFGTGAAVFLAALSCISAFVGWYAAEMLMGKTTRVFFRGWKRLALLCAAILVFYAVGESDLLGYERRVPEAAEAARAEVEKVHPGCMWLAETVHRSFGAACRAAGMTCARDSEAFEAFDMEYEYDVQEAFERYLKGEIPLSCYLDLLDFQENLYPENYDKLRFLENHDVPRIASHVKSESDLRNYTAMLYFKKGTTLVYAGQEAACSHQPSLFDRDTIDWNTGIDLSGLMRHMAQIKHDVLEADDAFFVSADDENDIAILRRDHNGRRKVGVFSLESRSAEVTVPLPDGTYENLIDGKAVAVADGRLMCSGAPIVLAADVERTWGV